MTTAGDWREREHHLAEVRQQVKLLDREPAGWAPRAALAAATLVWLTALVWQAVTLPDQVPMHWSNGDEPDRWGSRGEALAFAALMPLLCAYPMLLMSRLALVWPDGINVPHKEWWLWTAPRLNRFERLFREDMMWFVALLILFLTGMSVSGAVAAHRPRGAMPQWGTWVGLGVFLVLTTLWTVRLAAGGRYRPREEDPELA